MAAVGGPRGGERQRPGGGGDVGGRDSRPPPPADEPGRSTATDRSLAILDLVLDAAVPLPARVIGDALGLPKATVHRQLAALEERALLARDPATGGFTVGAGLSELAFKVLRRSAERGLGHAVLAGLSAETGETCNLGVLDNGLARYVDRVEAFRSPLRLDVRPGSTVPLHCSAIGKVFLAAMPERLLGRYLAALRLAPHGPNTIRDPGRLAEAVAQARAEGAAVDDEELLAGVNCLAVPVRRGGQVVAAVAIQAPKARSDLARLRQFLPRLNAAAARLGATMDEGAGEARRPTAARDAAA